MIEADRMETPMTDVKSTQTPRRFFGVSPGSDIDRYYEVRIAELSKKHPEIPNLSLRTPAHITIMPPFATDDFEMVHTLAESVALESHPFTLEFSGFDSFGTETFYLGVKRSQELNLLSHVLGERLMETVTGSREETEGKSEQTLFHPHVSLARHLTGETQELARQFFSRDIERHFPPVRIGDFRLYRLDGDQYVVEKIYFLE